MRQTICAHPPCGFAELAVGLWIAMLAGFDVVNGVMGANSKASEMGRIYAERIPTFMVNDATRRDATAMQDIAETVSNDTATSVGVNDLSIGIPKSIRASRPKP